MKTNVWKFVCNNGQSYEDRHEAFCVVFASAWEEAIEAGLRQVKKEYGETYTHDAEATLVRIDVEVPDESPVSVELRLKVNYLPVYKETTEDEIIKTAKEQLAVLFEYAHSNGLFTGISLTSLKVKDYTVEFVS